MVRRAPTAFLPLLSLYLICVVRFHIRDELQVQTFTLLNVAVLLSGLVTIYAISAIVDAVTTPKSYFRLAAAAGLVFLQMILCTYHLRCHAQLDYKVVSENIGIAFHKESLDLIGGLAKRDDYFLGIAALAAVGALWRWKRFQPDVKRSWWSFPSACVAYCLCARLAPYSYDEVTAFAQSFYWSHFPLPALLKPIDSMLQYPCVAQTSNLPNASAPDNVFLILVESFNANFVSSKTSDGKEYTPFFNSLLKQGLFFDNFWGNSVQTSKGQFAVLSSMPPISIGKEFTDFPNVRLRCLPKILSEFGYDTYFFQGFDSLSFEGTGNFMKRNGFKHVNAMDSTFISAAERKQYRWGWGIQDNILYTKAFQYLDAQSRLARAGASPLRRFTLLSTISSHMKFKDVPQAQRALFPEQSSKAECYANAIHAADDYLKTFFEELAKRKYLSNSVVIITGDHSYPAGEHGQYDSESGFYNEYFRTPLLIWGPGIKPGVNHDLHSQIDIAPTVLEMGGISTKTHFTGKSVFAGPSDWAPLVQPYAGTYFCSICQRTRRSITP
jgi:hypothetical protein